MFRDEIIEEIRLRKNNNTFIRAKINDFFLSEYCIPNIFSYIDNYFYLNNSNFKLCFPRQVITSQVEQIAAFFLSKYLNYFYPVNFEFWSFGSDSFTNSNSYKKSLLDYKKISRNGVVYRNKLTSKSSKKYFRSILEDIRIKNGLSLTSHHSKYLFKNNLNVTINNNLIRFFRSILYKLNNNKSILPYYVFLSNEDKKEFRMYRGSYRISPKNINKVRPPAHWFYLFHLISFLDGSRGLISAEGHDDEVKSWFQKNSDLLYEICGFRPLIIDIPDKVVTSSGYESDLLEINTAFFEPGWQERIVDPEGENLDLFEVYKFYAKQLLELRPVKK
jgi:hypothetical protein